MRGTPPWDAEYTMVPIPGNSGMTRDLIILFFTFIYAIPVATRLVVYVKAAAIIANLSPPLK